MESPVLGRDWKNEISGALGDLGTFIPHVVAAITIAGLNPTGVFTMFGLTYILTGMVYRLPVPVQPMKAASAAILTQNLTAGQVAGAGMVIGLLLLILASTGIIDYVARVTPRSVTSGIQLGLGLSLALLGLKLAIHDPMVGGPVLVTTLLLLTNPRIPVAITAMALGIALNFILGHGSLPELHAGIHLPNLVMPGWSDIKRGTVLAVIPQLPLTLTNAIIVTSALAADLFPGRAQRVSVRNLALTQGFVNLIGAPLGGYPMCHGSGGMAAHYRFGARTRFAPLCLGVFFVGLGVILGADGLKLLRVIPEGALGALLFFGGLDLANAIRVDGREGLFTTLIVAVISLQLSPAIGFLAGLVVSWLQKRNVIAFTKPKSTGQDL